MILAPSGVGKVGFARILLLAILKSTNFKRLLCRFFSQYFSLKVQFEKTPCTHLNFVDFLFV